MISGSHLAMLPCVGKQMLTESEVAHTSPESGSAYVAMVATETITAVVSSLEALTVVAITSAPGTHPLVYSVMQSANVKSARLLV